MSFATLQREIVAELRRITKRPKLRLKDLMEWKTVDSVKVGSGEEKVYIPSLRIYAVIVKKEAGGG